METIGVKEKSRPLLKRGSTKNVGLDNSGSERWSNCEVNGMRSQTPSGRAAVIVRLRGVRIDWFGNGRQLVPKKKGDAKLMVKE